MLRNMQLGVRRAALAVTTALSVTAFGAVAAGGAGEFAAPKAQAAERVSVVAKDSTSQSCKKGEPALRARVKDDRKSPPVWRSPKELTFGLGSKAKTNLDKNLGPIKPGSAWMIGSTQVPGVPWLGTNTMHPQLLSKTTGGVNFKLTSFSGPGNMFVFEQGNLGKVVGDSWFKASGGSVSGSHVVPRNSHVHPNWVFDKPGTYKVGITQTATLKNGKKISAPAVLTFKVGGAGNANSGHFDFGSDVTTNGDCDAAGTTSGGSSAGESSGKASGKSGASAGADSATGSETSSGASSAGEAAGADTAGEASKESLPDTGMTNGTLPMLALGLGITVLGAGLMYYLRSTRAASHDYGRR